MSASDEEIVGIVPFGAAKGAYGEVGATGEDGLSSGCVPVCGGAADFFVGEAGPVEVRVEFGVGHSPLAVTGVGEHGGVGCPGGFSDGVATLEGEFGCAFEIGVLVFAGRVEEVLQGAVAAAGCV